LSDIPVATRDEALEQMQDFGLDIKYLDVDTANIKRVGWDGKRTRDGFYRLWSLPGGDKVAGFYGKYCHGYEIHKVESERKHDDSFTEAQRFQLKKKMEESRVKIQQEFKPDLTLWDEAEDCDNHPYLKNKGVKAHGLKSIKGPYCKELLIPMRDKEGDITGIQRIMENGKKLMLKGSSKKASFHTIEGSDVYALCEGYATGATIHEATGWTVIVCFDCGNLRPVARNFRTQKMIICADNDDKTDKNPGVTKAKDVQKIYHCPVVAPKESDSDFNDVGLESAKAQLLPMEPKSFMDQLDELEDKPARERFIMNRKEYLAQFPKDEFNFLKNRVKEHFDISKKDMDEVIAGIKSDEQLQAIEDALKELESVRYDGKSYFKLMLSAEGDKYYSTTQQEISLLVDIASNTEKDVKQKSLDWIHREKVVGEVVAESMPCGRSHIKEFLSADGSLTIKKFVSAEKCIESRLAELDDVQINETFIQYVQESYPEVIDVIEASLARKFCESKKAFVYFKCNTGYGKTFFFGPESMSRTFTKRYKVEEFRGNSPDDFLKPLFLFIDEADSFPSEYKVNDPEYKRLYGGIARVKLGMRVLASANGIEDLERGIDPQIRERVVYIEPKEQRLDHHGIEKGLSLKMWEKWILNRMANKLMEWASSGDVRQNCESFFDGFLRKYSTKAESTLNLEDIAIEHIVDLLGMNWKHPIDGFNFSTLVERFTDNWYFITSPKKFFKELFKCFDEERLKAFSSQFKTSKDYESMLHFQYHDAMRINGKVKRGLFFATEKTDDGFIVAKLSATEQKIG